MTDFNTNEEAASARLAFDNSADADLSREETFTGYVAEQWHKAGWLAARNYFTRDRDTEKAVAENEDAVTNAARKPRGQRTAKEQEKVTEAVESESSKDTDARARRATSGAAVV